VYLGDIVSLMGCAPTNRLLAEDKCSIWECS
jgi:hypothetical protein